MQLTKHQIVRFRNPEDDDEAKERFIVLEDRGDRVLVGAVVGFDNWEIAPTFVYHAADLEVVEPV